jgi:hypothetical protein
MLSPCPRRVGGIEGESEMHMRDFVVRYQDFALDPVRHPSDSASMPALRATRQLYTLYL